MWKGNFVWLVVCKKKYLLVENIVLYICILRCLMFVFGFDVKIGVKKLIVDMYDCVFWVREREREDLFFFYCLF